MACAIPRSGYQRTQTESKHPAYFDEDDSAILDPTILDADIMQSPNNAQHRKDSFANSNGVLSPADSHGHAWEPQHQQHHPHHHVQYAGLPIESASAGASNPYHEDNNGFVVRHGPPMPPQQPSYGYPSQHSQWAYDQASGQCTPTTGLEFMPAPQPFETHQYPATRNDSVQGNFNQPMPPPQSFPPPHAEANFIPAPQVQTPMSPHCHQDWMGMAQQEMDSRPMPKRMRPNSPPVTMVDYARRDGIRKKNGRIEIPPERNIKTIDGLIDQTTDEDLLKELKQQKRLLRNREAALLSRQRKKQHTEDLEIKEKGYTNQITMLEDQIKALSIECQQRDEERRLLVHRYQESQHNVESLQEEMRTLKVQHNEENSKLRKRINLLTEQIDAGPAPTMSAAPSSTGFTDFNAEMEALNMGTHDWDNFIFVNDLQNESTEDFSFDQRQMEPIAQSPTLHKQTSSNTIVPSPQAKSKDNASDQPIATGLLFMLLLCGAFVASKPANSQPRGMPQMPAEVRAAAPTVLSSLLSESVDETHNKPSRSLAYPRNEPQPSGLPQHGQGHSRLDHMHHHLTAPTKQQQIDEAFSLTPAQYASINNMNMHDFDEHLLHHQQSNPARPRRNLAETLANLQHQHQQSNRAEVYTRSLLWDQIPTEVVKQFKEMVADQNDIDTRRNQQRTSQSDMYHGYKTEA